ncbi:hypothetical protein EDC26_102382 [Paralcaligenes ureilyticus]|uniref:Uncharacterized protein n=1 Tax=Paralcaligenes ureilyticus TaxID=627131 RepID=A0A4R3MBA6_9BURK|nr:hypothetical protein EDC26_102382 [Paralcaligenes ureilyticus]
MVFEFPANRDETSNGSHKGCRYMGYGHVFVAAALVAAIFESGNQAALASAGASSLTELRIR